MVKSKWDLTVSMPFEVYDWINSLVERDECMPSRAYLARTLLRDGLENHISHEDIALTRSHKNKGMMKFRISDAMHSDLQQAAYEASISLHTTARTILVRAFHSRQ